MRARFKVFSGVFKSWEEICERADVFVQAVGRDNLISVSHTADPGVVVCYWENEAAPVKPSGDSRR